MKADNRTGKENNKHKQHRERLRQSFLKNGAGSLHEHQLLELLLFYSIPQKDTNELAHQLIDTYGGAEKVFKANPYDLEKQKGIGEYTAVLLSICGELIKRYGDGKIQNENPRLNVPEAAMRYCRGLFDNSLNEQTYVISLDSNKKVLHSDLLATGTPKENIIYPRLVVEKAIRHGASSIILTHNHPSGNVKPSLKDIETTKQIFEILDKIGIELFDHIIISDTKAYSMVRGDEFNLFSLPSSSSLFAAQKE